MKQEITLRDFYNRIIGYVETDTITGNKVGKDFYHRPLGFYDKNTNMTTDFYHRPIAKGDILAALINDEDRKQEKRRSKK